jgi:glyoxylase-like metal-dependent hydrolase (beta-lactamase superfamily II)
VLTCPWHERGTQGIAQRRGVRVFAPRPDEDGPDLAWLLSGDVSAAHLFAVGDRLPIGVEALPGRLPDDLVLWVERTRAVIAGDTLVDFGQGLEIPPEWLPDGVAPGQVADDLRPLLDLPVDVVLATHGGPADRTALERALA